MRSGKPAKVKRAQKRLEKVIATEGKRVADADPAQVLQAIVMLRALAASSS